MNAKLIYSMLTTLMFSGYSAISQPFSGCIAPHRKVLFGDPGARYHPENNREKKLWLYTDAGLHAAQVDQDWAGLLQFGAGLVYNNQLAGGVTFYTTPGFFNPDPVENENARYKMRLLGGEVQYTFFPKKLFSVSIPLVFALGSLRQDTLEGNQVVASERNDHIGVIQPGIKLELNMTTRFKVGTGIHYRQVYRADYLPSESLTGASFSLSARYLLF